MPTPEAICVTDDSTFWPWLTWSDFAQMPRKEEVVVVLPIAGFADWGLGHAYDAEEQVLTNVLKHALALKPAGLRALVLPPLRFVLGPEAGCVFAVETPVAIGLINETVSSIKAAGFSRVVLCNASPWNEELVDAAARDLRIALGLQMFCVNLSALKLDFHPVRSRSRREVQTLLTYLNQRNADPVPADADASAGGWSDERVRPLAGAAVPLAQANIDGAAQLAAAAAHLVSLLGEIAARPPLPNGGAIVTRTYP